MPSTPTTTMSSSSSGYDFSSNNNDSFSSVGYDDDDDLDDAASTLSQTFARAQTSLDAFMANVEDDSAPGALRLDDDASSVWSEDVSHADDLQRLLSQAENDFQMQFAFVMAELNLANALNKGGHHGQQRKVGMNSHLVEQYVKSLSVTDGQASQQQQRRKKSSLMQQRIQAFESPRNSATTSASENRRTPRTGSSNNNKHAKRFVRKDNGSFVACTIDNGMKRDSSNGALQGLQGIGMLEEI